MEEKETVTGSLDFSGTQEEQKNAAISVIIGLIEHYDINEEDLGY